ncbi:MAG: serine/threonine-protein kinase, partial [Saprospiraceae bacterium]
MSPEEIYRLGKDAFEHAAELDPVPLEVFLGELHPLVRKEVEELLFYEEKADQIFGVAQPALTSESPVSLALEGRQLAKYILRKVIGSGGAATVYLANRADALFEKEVAIKVLHQRVTSEETFKRFQRELQVLARLEHQCIVRFSQADITEDKLAYIVMEFIDGVHIDQYCSAVSLGERVRLVLRVAEAFSVAHEQKVIHRDIKPQNILVTNSGVPKLLDFGVALLLDAPVRLTVPGEGRITIPYASPEQILGGSIGPTTDIYSLGVVFYEVLCSRRPFVGEPALQLMQTILKDDPPSLLALNPEVTRSLEAICFKMLEKNPRDRYQTMAEVGTDLNLFLDGSEIPAKRRRYFGVPRFFRKHAKGGAGALAFILLTALLAFLYFQRKRADEHLGRGIEFFQMTVLQVTQA